MIRVRPITHPDYIAVMLPMARKVLLVDRQTGGKGPVWDAMDQQYYQRWLATRRSLGASVSDWLWNRAFQQARAGRPS